MSFLELPAELIQQIASYLPAESLFALCQTCKKLNEIGNIESLWAALSYKDFQVRGSKGWNLSYKEIYTKVLRKFHGILGVKRLALIPYGGLVNVCWAEGEIQVNRYQSKSEDNASSNLSSQQLFSLRWNEALQDMEVFCVQCPSDHRPAKFVQAGKYPLLQCADIDCHIAHTLKELRHGQSDRRFKCYFNGHRDAFKAFDLDKGFNCPMLPLPMPSQADQARSPIQLGLYKGDYGSHGVEILNFTLNQTNPLHLEGLKIVGDPNVPAGNISVIVHLDKPVVLSEEDQISALEMLRVDEQRTEESFAQLLNVNNNNNTDHLRQPFVVPVDCFDRDQSPPNTCISRYLGTGRIAGHLYNHPSHCKCHFIQFSDVQFAVMWLELSLISMFYKVTEDFSLYLSRSSKDHEGI